MKRFGTIRIVTLLLFCISSTVLSAPPVALDDLRITRHMTRWHEDSASYQTFTPDDLFNLINGAAPEYIDNGLVNGFFQRLSSPDSATLEIFVDDFGTGINAQKMFTLKRQTIAEPYAIPGLDTATYCAGTIIGGMAAYGIVDQFYFELVLTGTKDIQTAAAELTRIFEYYKKIIK